MINTAINSIKGKDFVHSSCIATEVVLYKFHLEIKISLPLLSQLNSGNVVQIYKQHLIHRAQPEIIPLQTWPGWILSFFSLIDAVYYPLRYEVASSISMGCQKDSLREFIIRQTSASRARCGE